MPREGRGRICHSRSKSGGQPENGGPTAHCKLLWGPKECDQSSLSRRAAWPGPGTAAPPKAQPPLPCILCNPGLGGEGGPAVPGPPNPRGMKVHSCVASLRLQHLRFLPEKGSHYSTCCYTQILRNTNQRQPGQWPQSLRGRGMGVGGRLV